jgi:hypothetical protein
VKEDEEDKEKRQRQRHQQQACSNKWFDLVTSNHHP